MWTRVSSERNILRKMRKFSVALFKLFRETSHFFRENKWSKNDAKFRENAKCYLQKIWRITKISRKCKNFGKTMSFITATILKRTCGILCSDSSTFEFLLCHMNNFFSFTLINVWWREFNFPNYLFKFLSVRPQYICLTG